MDSILCRRSVRKFDLEKKLEFNELKELCKYAEAAPSAKNQRSREYIIVDDKEIIEQLSLVARGTMLLSECNSLFTFKLIFERLPFLKYSKFFISTNILPFPLISFKLGSEP